MTDATRPIIGIENRTPQEVFDINVSPWQDSHASMKEPL